MKARSPLSLRPANIHDVAALCGVAPSTVSRALSATGRISAPTRARIQAAAADMGYVPSRSARALSSGRTGTIGMVVPNIAQTRHSALVRAVNLHLRSAGFAQILVDTDSSALAEASALRQLRKSADGVIMVSPAISDGELLIATGQQPLVVVNRRVEGVASVLTAPHRAVNQLLDHLRASGHTRIALVADTTADNTSLSRKEDWSKRLKAKD